MTKQSRAFEDGAKNERDAWIDKITRELEKLDLKIASDIFIGSALTDLKMWGLGRRIVREEPPRLNNRRHDTSRKRYHSSPR